MYAPGASCAPERGAGPGAGQIITPMPGEDAGRRQWDVTKTSPRGHTSAPLETPRRPLVTAAVGRASARGGAHRTTLVNVQATGHVDELVALRIPDLSLVRQAIEEAKLTEWGVRREGMDAALRPGRAALVTIDANALGGGLADELEGRGWPVERFFGQGSPSEWDAALNKKFVNRRAATAWALREAFAGGRVAIPPDPELVAEVLAVQYVHRPDGKIILEAKDELRSRLGRSPDLFDALAMALSGVDGSFAGISAQDGVVSF
jgi:hypothetical protein